MSENVVYKTEQEDFWAGDFGNDYVDRSHADDFIPARIHMFSEILKHTNNVNSFMEFGPNIGLNLKALRILKPDAEIKAIEINEKACGYLRDSGFSDIKNESFLETDATNEADFVFTSGVLIHINPDALNRAYENMYNASRRYICLSEYYNPTPVEVDYRGNKERLFKRDFAGELLDKYSDLRLVSYGFIYNRDANFSQDDTNWFLLEKTKV